MRTPIKTKGLRGLSLPLTLHHIRVEELLFKCLKCLKSFFRMGKNSTDDFDPSYRVWLVPNTQKRYLNPGTDILPIC